MNAYNISSTPVLLRTYRSREIPLDCKIWEAARATSAGPTFFKRVEIKGQPFIDGGIGCNNPSRLLLDEAKALFNNRQIGCLVSVGAGAGSSISIKKPGVFQRIVATDVMDTLKAIATDCEYQHETMSHLFGNSPNTYFRLNVERGVLEIDLSEWERMATVEAQTAQYTRRRDIDDKLALLVNAIRVPRAQLVFEQLSTGDPLLSVCTITQFSASRPWDSS